MLDKFLNSLRTALVSVNNSVDNVKIGGLPRFLVLFFAFIFFFMVGLFIVAWMTDWYLSSKPNLQIFISFFKELFGPAVVGTVVIIGKALIDSDENGAPDVWEKEIEKGISSTPSTNFPSTGNDSKNIENNLAKISLQMKK